MAGFIFRRLLTTLVVLAIVSLLSFSLMQLVPGDPALVLAGVGATGDQVQHIRQEFGLDQPFAVQLLRWYGGLLHGNLGDSVLLGQSVMRAIADHVPPTVSVALFASVLSIVAGVGSGILAAVNQGRLVDRIVMGVAVLGVSVPSFWLGLLLMVLLAVQLDWLPAGGYVPLAQDPWQWFRSLVLPGVSLALLQIGYLAQITRNALIDVPAPGFHPQRAGEGPGGMDGGDEARAEQCHAADPDGDGHHVQPAFERVGGDRDSILRARPRAADGRCDSVAGLSGDSGNAAADGGGVRGDQPVGGYPLRDGGPPRCL